MYKILVIEDEQIVRTNILELLKAEGYQVIEAKNGLTGLELAQSESPNLIICDVLMPKLDGFGVLQVLQQNPQTATIPLIFLTAKSDRSDLRHGMTLGADDYITKPFTRKELLETIAVRLTKQAQVLQLKQNIEALEQSNLLKDDFLNTVAHELRSPLANIKMAIELLHHCPDAQAQQSYLRVLQSECAREVELLNDLLDLQKLELADRQVSLEIVHLPSWIAKIAEPFYVRTAERQQIFKLSVLPTLPPLLLDLAAVQRILTELLNNACKYTAPGGKVCLDVYLPLPPVADHLTFNALTFVVSNSAEIPLAAQPRLFEQFYRVPQGDRWQQGGSGLGLTLVKKLVEQLKGTIDMTSEAGWTQFTLNIPLPSTLL